MSTFPSLRPRIPAERVNGALVEQGVPGIPQRSQVAGGFGSALFNALFGSGYPSERGGTDPTAPVQKSDTQGGTPNTDYPAGGLYHFHEGDLFTPGTGNYVYDAPFELPMKTLWGGSTAQAFLRTPNVWKVLQPPQVYSQPTVKTSGIGGPVAGQMILQPLNSEDGE
jgi:hypothetical protein